MYDGNHLSRKFSNVKSVERFTTPGLKIDLMIKSKTLIKIKFQCLQGPHPLCDNFFYRVLPLFDCVYIIGAVVGLIAARVNHPMLYLFFWYIFLLKTSLESSFL